VNNYKGGSGSLPLDSTRDAPHSSFQVQFRTDKKAMLLMIGGVEEEKNSIAV
jgi:hypothetical protein